MFIKFSYISIIKEELHNMFSLILILKCFKIMFTKYMASSEVMT